MEHVEQTTATVHLTDILDHQIDAAKELSLARSCATALFSGPDEERMENYANVMVALQTVEEAVHGIGHSARSAGAVATPDAEEGAA